MLLLGIDVGTSSIKVSVVDAFNQQCLASYRYPEQEETPISVPQDGWAEQSPDMWWEHVQQAILGLNSLRRHNPLDVKAIGIAYQMHGLVLVDKNYQSLRDAIIWCDSRAVEIGAAAFENLGEETMLHTHLNSPGNFTASKLAWVKKNEPAIYDRIYKVMLPGDYISLKLTGNISTSISALSEGVFWDFSTNELSGTILDYFGFDPDFFPPINPVFSVHGYVHTAIAAKLGLTAGIPVSYKAGDQPNNALSLNVLKPGDVAATAGTSGVIYGVSQQLVYDRRSRVNTFAHVNYDTQHPLVGVLLCINGTGILNRWVKDQFGGGVGYETMNQLASQVPFGSDGLSILPFGNGAERMLENRVLGAQILNLDLNKHDRRHLFRACQEGIAFAFKYGLDIMKENGMQPQVIRAGKTNLFLSKLFAEIFVDVTGVPLELYEHDGSVGAAIGAGIGAGTFEDATDAFHSLKPIKVIEPHATSNYQTYYQKWFALLNEKIK